MVSNVAKVDLRVFLEHRPFFLLEGLHRLRLRPDYSPKRYDIAPQQRHTRERFARILTEDQVLNVIDVLPNPVQNGEAVVDQPVENKVEQVSGAAAHAFLSGLLARFTRSEQSHQGLEVSLVQGNQIVLADEYGDLTRRGHARLGIEHREMEHHEGVFVVLIDLGQLDPAQAVVQVQGMEGVVLGQVLGLRLGRLFDIDPGQLLPGDRLDARPSPVSVRSSARLAPSPHRRSSYASYPHRHETTPLASTH